LDIQGGVCTVPIPFAMVVASTGTAFWSLLRNGGASKSSAIGDEVNGVTIFRYLMSINDAESVAREDYTKKKRSTFVCEKCGDGM